MNPFKDIWDELSWGARMIVVGTMVVQFSIIGFFLWVIFRITTKLAG